MFGKREGKSRKALNRSAAWNGIPSGSRHNNNFFEANSTDSNLFFSAHCGQCQWQSSLQEHRSYCFKRVQICWNTVQADASFAAYTSLPTHTESRNNNQHSIYLMVFLHEKQKYDGLKGNTFTIRLSFYTAVDMTRELNHWSATTVIVCLGLIGG